MENKFLPLRSLRSAFVFLLIFLSSCSSQRYKMGEWCEDVFIPGNKYYATNVKQQEGFEVPPVLHAKDILPPEMQKSKLFKVKDEVYSDGVIDHFYLTSKWGDSIAAGYLILKTRINEVNAIESLDRLESSSFFKGIGKSAVGMVTAPWHLLKLGGRAFSGGDEKQDEENKRDQEELEKIKELALNDQDKEKDETDFKNKRLQNVLDSDRDTVQHVLYSNEETADVDTISSLIGVRKNVVEILEKFHIDPDNTNPLLREKVLRIAKMEALGGLSTALVPAAPVLTVLSTTKTVVDTTNSISIYSSEQEQKKKIHDGLLLAGCSERLIDIFEKSEGFSTFLKVIIANHVIRLRNVKDVKELIKIAITVDDVEVGWIAMQAFAILPTLYEQIPFVRFIKDSPVPTVVTRDNRVIIAYAGDHLYWIRDTSMLFNKVLEAIEEDGIKPSVIEARIKGIPSERFKRELEALGIKYVPVHNVKYQIELYNE